MLGSVSKAPVISFVGMLTAPGVKDMACSVEVWAACSEQSGNYKWKLVRKAIAPAFSTANLKCAAWSLSTFSSNTCSPEELLYEVSDGEGLVQAPVRFTA